VPILGENRIAILRTRCNKLDKALRNILWLKHRKLNALFAVLGHLAGRTYFMGSEW